MARVVGLPQPLADAAARVGDDRTLIAGTGEHRQAPFLDWSQEDWEQTVAGIRVAYQAARDTAAELAESGTPGRLIFVSTAAAIRPVHGAGLEATAGAFFHTFAQVAAVELAARGITANVVAPGFVSDERFIEATPAGRAPEPDDVARVCAFLASDNASYVTGAVIPVDGGFSITKSGGGSPLVTE
jgi:NAD(P)-dependent dehydrogenase (short-subunit alcohol dehydrogenase family)